MGAVTARLVLTTAGAVLISAAFTACRAGGGEGRRPAHADIAPVLLFNGAGTSPEDVASLEKILRSEHLDYSTVNSPTLNGMSESQIREYRLLIVPGGNFEHIGNSLTSGATANIHNAVQNGLNYLGICAGAFFAGNSPYNGLNLTSGSRFGFYSAEGRGVRKAPVAIAAAGAPVPRNTSSCRFMRSDIALSCSRRSCSIPPLTATGIAAVSVVTTAGVGAGTGVWAAAGAAVAGSGGSCSSR